LNTNANIVFAVCACLLASLCFVHFRHAKRWTAAFAGVLLLQAFCQTAFLTVPTDWAQRTFGIAVLVIFLPSLLFYVAAVIHDWKRWGLFSLAAVVLTLRWFSAFLTDALC